MGADGTTGDVGTELHAVGRGRYVLRRPVGKGGMATVHLAHDTVLDRPVAVKILHGRLGLESSARERFRREARAVARLSHINVVAVHDSGEDVAGDGTPMPYIVMEYVEGRPLSAILCEEIERHGAILPEQAVKITTQVLSALAAAHEQGLVHRDIKPSNVMVSSGGLVKVMDFGIARVLQSGVTSLTATGMMVGTAHYLAPEQALGKSVDPRSDLYSVGCMVFELLTGRPPFLADNALSIAYQHVRQPPPTPSSINPAITPSLDTLVARALRKDPAHRFPTAEAMRDELERAAADRQRETAPVAARATGQGTPAQPSPGQRPTLSPCTPEAGTSAAGAAPSSSLRPSRPAKGDSVPAGRRERPRRSVVLSAVGAALALALAVTVAAEFVHGNVSKDVRAKASRKAGNPDSASGDLTAASPWRLVVSDKIEGQDNGCRVTLTNTESRRRQTLHNYGTESFQMQASGHFHWEANNAACEVVSRPGPGQLALPFSQQYGLGDTDAFEAPGVLLVKVLDFNGAGECPLELHDAANGETVDLGTARMRDGSVRLDPGGHSHVYLAALQCSVRVAPTTHGSQRGS
ncbi:protein kinase [Streptomyces sp. NPDC001093]|uniref:protein kinase domain-containing protein n=1 Tax=Streptomyces sp. NPDC001093 TaxID=3154376 RepID=UPI00333341A7